jgi:hypothetical protein
MALTTAQKLSLFEILEVPYQTTADSPVDEFKLSGETTSATATDALATKILSRISALSSDEETRLTTYITRWDELGTTRVAVNGGVAEVSGVSWSVEDELRAIQQRVKIIIPVLQYRAELELGGSRGVSAIPVLR